QRYGRDASRATPTDACAGARTRRRRLVLLLHGTFGAVCALAAGCSPSQPAATRHEPVTLTIASPLARGPGTEPGMGLPGAGFERLTTYDAHGRPAPLLAERWAQSPDGRTWRLSLRRGVRFHDGAILDATQVRDAIREAAANPAMRANSVCLPDILNVTTDGERDVVVHLARPCAFLLDDFEFSISHVGPDGEPSGTGPFMRTGSTDNDATFAAFTHYHAGRPQVDRVVVRAYETLRAPWAEMMREQIDLLLEVGPDGFEFLRDQSTVETRSYTAFKPIAIVLNSGRKALGSPEVRRALSKSVDRAELVEQGLKGQGLPADTPVWPLFWAAEDSKPWATIPFDPGAARGILAKNGRLVITCLIPAGHSVFERLALLVQRQWRSVGVDMRLEEVPVNTLRLRVGTGDFDAAMIDPLGGPYASYQYRFWHSPNPDARWNVFNYRSPVVDAALDTLRGSVSEDEFRLAMGQFIAAVRVDPPAIFLVWPARAQAISRRFILPDDAAGTDAVRSVARWRLRGDAR
ncbi:MAG: ABC transporter substrate-binding protein, partial [Vicinamibacterales bacterium]|nr:ABC transporter substrate-binding protein [Vicinamibacterales bacterium]